MSWGERQVPIEKERHTHTGTHRNREKNSESEEREKVTEKNEGLEKSTKLREKRRERERYMAVLEPSHIFWCYLLCCESASVDTGKTKGSYNTVIQPERFVPIYCTQN